MGVAPDCGHLHPLMKVRTQFRQIFLEMGLVPRKLFNYAYCLFLTYSYSIVWMNCNWLLNLFYAVMLHNKLLFTAVCRFTEMPTNNFIESSFWNFDSLFQPQQHPARDQHDTFFLSGRIMSYSDLFQCRSLIISWTVLCFQIQQWLINFLKTT